MMLRSSSTPILGSLLSSNAESTGSQLHHHQLPESLTPNRTQSSAHHSIKKLISVNNTHVGFQSFTKPSCNSSPNTSPTGHDQFSCSPPFFRNGFRRAQSEGNLERLAADEFSLAVPVKKFARKTHGSFLEAIPSFSLLGSRNHHEHEESDDYEEEEVEEDEEADKKWEVFGRASGGGDSHGLGTEEHYKKMLEENPSNPLLLRNYARFLYQIKGDVIGAEEYYSRAILADPGDGEVLSQYAKLVWEVRRDAENATSYFERAVQAAAGDSHVEAAYASFFLGGGRQ